MLLNKEKRKKKTIGEKCWTVLLLHRLLVRLFVRYLALYSMRWGLVHKYLSGWTAFWNRWRDWFSLLCETFLMWFIENLAIVDATDAAAAATTDCYRFCNVFQKHWEREREIHLQSHADIHTNTSTHIHIHKPRMKEITKFLIRTNSKSVVVFAYVLLLPLAIVASKCLHFKWNPNMPISYKF